MLQKVEQTKSPANKITSFSTGANYVAKGYVPTMLQKVWSNLFKESCTKSKAPDFIFRRIALSHKKRALKAAMAWS